MGTFPLSRKDLQKPGAASFPEPYRGPSPRPAVLAVKSFPADASLLRGGVPTAGARRVPMVWGSYTTREPHPPEVEPVLAGAIQTSALYSRPVMIKFRRGKACRKRHLPPGILHGRGPGKRRLPFHS